VKAAVSNGGMRSRGDGGEDPARRRAHRSRGILRRPGLYRGRRSRTRRATTGAAPVE